MIPSTPSHRRRSREWGGHKVFFRVKVMAVFIPIFFVIMRGVIIATALMRIIVIFTTEMMEEVLEE
jgi:hypothetical protein